MSASPTFAWIRGHTLYTPPLGADSVILDLGANRGEFARQASERFGGKYYLVEANPTFASVLRADGRFPVWHAAIGTADGPVTFNVAKNDEGSSLLDLQKDSPYGLVLEEAIQVPGRTLDSLMTEIGERRIDVLKMDIEGAEVMVLRSLSERRLREIGQITVEFHTDPLFGFHLAEAVEEVMRSLERAGFLCLDFTNTRRIDVLCINLALNPIPWPQRARWSFRTTPPAWLLRRWRAMPPSWKNNLRRFVSRVSGVSDPADESPADSVSG
jgi:FkbM family methyltransferase